MIAYLTILSILSTCMKQSTVMLLTAGKNSLNTQLMNKSQDYRNFQNNWLAANIAASLLQTLLQVYSKHYYMPPAIIAACLQQIQHLKEVSIAANMQHICCMFAANILPCKLVCCKLAATFHMPICGRLLAILLQTLLQVSYKHCCKFAANVYISTYGGLPAKLLQACSKQITT